VSGFVRCGTISRFLVVAASIAALLCPLPHRMKIVLGHVCGAGAMVMIGGRSPADLVVEGAHECQ
jgi:hypothetical protein